MHDWVGKVIHWEICKRYKLTHATIQNIHKPVSTLENETFKIRSNFR